MSVFELEQCSFFFLDISEYHQNLIGAIIRVLVRNLREQSAIGNLERDKRVSLQSEPSVCVCGGGGGKMPPFWYAYKVGLGQGLAIITEQGWGCEYGPKPKV